MTPTPNHIALLVSLIGAGLSQPARAMSATSILVDEFAPSELSLTSEVVIPEVKAMLAPPVAGTPFPGLDDPATMVAAGANIRTTRLQAPAFTIRNVEARSQVAIDPGERVATLKVELDWADRDSGADANEAVDGREIGATSAVRTDLDPWGFPYQRSTTYVADGPANPAHTFPVAVAAVPGSAMPGDQKGTEGPDLIEQLWATLPHDEAFDQANASDVVDAAVALDASDIDAAAPLVRLDDDDLEVRSERVAGPIELDPWGYAYQRIVDDGTSAGAAIPAIAVQAVARTTGDAPAAAPLARLDDDDLEVRSERVAGPVELDPWGYAYRRVVDEGAPADAALATMAVRSVARVPAGAAASAQPKPQPIVDRYWSGQVLQASAIDEVATHAEADAQRVALPSSVVAQAETPPSTRDVVAATDSRGGAVVETIDALEPASTVSHVVADAVADSIEETLGLSAGASTIELLTAFAQQPLIETDIDLTEPVFGTMAESPTSKVLATLAEVLSPQWSGPSHAQTASPEGNAEDILRRFLESADDASSVADGAAPLSPLGGEVVAVRDEQLGDVRGGFTTPDGLKFSFGIERAVYINGNLSASTSLNMTDLGKISGGRDIGSVVPGSAIAVIQNGPGNVFQGGPVTANSLGTVIQNTLNNQNIQSVTTINATVNSLGILKSMNEQAAVQRAIADSVPR